MKILHFLLILLVLMVAFQTNSEARYYDPVEGRFISPDPIGFLGGINPYVYTENNPINMIDPFGLYPGQLPPAPPGYDPTTWAAGRWDNGRWYLRSPNDTVYTVHPEDDAHWRHWDIRKPDGKDGGSWPSNPGKRRPGQKKLKPNQCETDPNGNADSWEPPPPFLPFLALDPIPETPVRLPVRVPIRVPIPAW